MASLKDLSHRLCILKKLAKLFKIVIFFPIRFNLLHPQPPLFLFVLESPPLVVVIKLLHL